jgi:hypothetical protein
MGAHEDTGTDRSLTVAAPLGRLAGFAAYRAQARKECADAQ